MMRLIVTTLAATLALTACQTTDPASKGDALVAEGWQSLDAAAMEASLVNHTHVGALKDGREWAAYYLPDGTMRGLVGDRADSGTYTIAEDGTYCRRWNTFVNGAEGCARYYQRGTEMSGVRVSGEFNVDTTWTVEPGNTRSL